jgi:hypothetical protein
VELGVTHIFSFSWEGCAVLWVGYLWRYVCGKYADRVWILVSFELLRKLMLYLHVFPMAVLMGVGVKYLFSPSGCIRFS